MKNRILIAAFAFLSLVSCRDRKDPGTPDEPITDTVTVQPPEAPPVPEKTEAAETVKLKSPDGKVEVNVPAPPPPPKPGQLPAPPPPPRISVK